MTKKVKLSEMTEQFKDVEILSLEGVTIEGDIDLDIGGLGSGFNPMLTAALGHESAILAQQFSRLGMFGVPAGRGVPGTAPAVSPSRATQKSKELIPTKRA